MPSRFVLFVFCLFIPAVASAQTGQSVNSGVNSDAGTMTGPNIDVVNGINANGTPRQKSPGSSMTNGAGNSTMNPGITGVPIPPNQGLATPTLSGTAPPPPVGPATH